MGTTATAASQGAGPATAAGACGGGAFGAVVASWVIRSVLRPVVTRFEVNHVSRGLLSPAGVPRAMGDYSLHRKPGPQERPALVFFNRDAHRHALHDLGELAGDDVSRHQRELRPGR